jgi:hypothetical protein
VSIYNNMGLERRIELGSVSSDIKTQGSWLGGYGLGARGWGSVCGGLGAIYRQKYQKHNVCRPSDQIYSIAFTPSNVWEKFPPAPLSLAQLSSHFLIFFKGRTALRLLQLLPAPSSPLPQIYTSIFAAPFRTPLPLPPPPHSVNVS